MSTCNCLLDQKPYFCYVNLKCCSVKQLFNISEGESSLNYVVTSSLHPAAAVCLLSKYSFPLFALMDEITRVFSNVCTAENNSHCTGCVPSCHLSSLAASFQKDVRGEGETSHKPGSVCGKLSCPKRKMGVLGWAVPSGMVGDPGTVPTLARQGGGQCWERTWGQQGSQMQL